MTTIKKLYNIGGTLMVSAIAEEILRRKDVYIIDKERKKIIDLNTLPFEEVIEYIENADDKEEAYSFFTEEEDDDEF